jgi:hypothetical protein
LKVELGGVFGRKGLSMTGASQTMAIGLSGKLDRREELPQRHALSLIVILGW